MQIVNQNVQERILIAMQNVSKANCNEDFRICAEESVDLCTSGRLYFSSGPFWTHKLNQS